MRPRAALPRLSGVGLSGPTHEPRVPIAPSVLLEGSPDASSSRRGFIEETATTLGRTWAVGRRRDLQREGRPASGGWPGTLREARALVEHALPIEMQGRSMNAITEPERELAARTAYASARNEWRRHVEPESP